MTMTDGDPFGFGEAVQPAADAAPPLEVPDLNDDPAGQDANVPPGSARVHPRAYPCWSCDQRFTRSNHLRRHMLEAHGISPEPGVQLKDPDMAGKSGRPPKPDTPPTIAVSIGGAAAKRSGKDKDLAAVEERARQLATTVAAVVLLMGQPEDAADLQRGAAVWGKSVADLAEHEEWLRKLAMGGETSARAMAWLQFAIATGALVSPILIRHELLPANLAAMAGTILQTGADLPTDG
jgi:hypothetical protein